MTSECIEVWYCSNSALVLVIIGINWILEGQRKYRKEAFLTLVWLLDTLICTKKLFSNSEPLSYMEARVRHINVCSNFCPRSRGKYGFWDFSEKKVFCYAINWRHIFLLFSVIEKLHLAVRRNCAKCGADPKKLPDFPIFIDRFQEMFFSNCLFPFIN